MKAYYVQIVICLLFLLFVTAFNAFSAEDKIVFKFSEQLPIEVTETALVAAITNQGGMFPIWQPNFGSTKGGDNKINSIPINCIWLHSNGDLEFEARWNDTIADIFPDGTFDLVITKRWSLTKNGPLSRSVYVSLSELTEGVS